MINKMSKKLEICLKSQKKVAYPQQNFYFCMYKTLWNVVDQVGRQLFVTPKISNFWQKI